MFISLVFHVLHTPVKFIYPSVWTLLLTSALCGLVTLTSDFFILICPISCVWCQQPLHQSCVFYSFYFPKLWSGCDRQLNNV